MPTALAYHLMLGLYNQLFYSSNIGTVAIGPLVIALMVLILTLTINFALIRSMFSGLLYAIFAPLKSQLETLP